MMIRHCERGLAMRSKRICAAMLIAISGFAGAALALANQAYAQTITTASPLPSATEGKLYSQTLTASGGKAPYTWSMVGGTMPGGLNLNPTTGILSGTPKASGSYSFTLRVTDSTTSRPLTAPAHNRQREIFT